jgi:hypothetical protein
MEQPFDLAKAIEDAEYEDALKSGRLVKLPTSCEGCGRFISLNNTNNVVLYEVSDYDGQWVPYAFYHKKCYKQNKGV